MIEIVGKTNHKSNMLPDLANASGLAAYPHDRSLPPFNVPHTESVTLKKWQWP